MLDKTKGDKGKEETKARIREVEDIAIEEGNECVIKVAKELRNRDETDLSYHVANNQIKIIEKNINRKDRLGVSYLSYACRFGNEEVVDLIIEKNREIGEKLKLTKDRFGRNAMHEAIESNCVNIIKKLPKEWMKEKDEEGEIPLFRLNRVETLNLIKEILGEEFKELLKERNKKGQNVLMKVIERYEGAEEVKGKKDRLEEIAIFLMDNRELLIELEKKRDIKHLGVTSEYTNKVVDIEGNNVLHYIARYSKDGIEIDLLTEEDFYRLSKQENRARELPRKIGIEKDNEEMIKRMYEKHEEKRRTKKGKSMMIEALRENSYGVIAMLIEKGIGSEVQRGIRRSNSMENLDNFDYEGVIRAGVEIGSVKTLEEVWKYEAKFPDNISEGMKKILEEKISENNEEALNWIIEKYVGSNNLTKEKDKELIFKVIENSIREGRIKFFKKALENEKIKKEILNYGYEENKYTLLILATFVKDEEMVKVLLEQGASIDKADEDGATPLFMAAYMGHKEVVKILLERGSQVNLCMKDNCSPLYIACKEGYKNIVRMLIDRDGIDKHIKIISDKYEYEIGTDALTIAIIEGNENIVKILIESGIELNYQLEEGKYAGKRPLDIAKEVNNEAIIKMIEDKERDSR